ncbi:MAG TPA: acyl-CoA dehydrogenase family protein [Alphaproteobacteria bacterium]|jgi:putative acyl-CoA dehydrogenase
MTMTHTVENQPPALADVNLYAIDKPLIEGLAREGGAWGKAEVAALGVRVGSAAYQETIRKANATLPVLRTHDRFGNRIDEVEFADAWHELMTVAKGAGLHSLPWSEPKQGAHVVRAALHYLFGQGEQGPSCPIAMTFAAVPALRQQRDIAEEWVPRLLGTEYDRRFIPAPKKSSALMGMAMTEKQGGSDVRANTTKAVPLGAGGPGGEYELTGHKWFCSAPMCDAFLTLAYTEKGLSCFIVPRFLPDGTRNRFLIQRLKDKLGNKTNASSEIEYDRTWARMVGSEGRGVATILEMVQHTRLECVIGSAAYMRAAFVQALHHVQHRRAFQRRLIDQPLMRAVVADLAVECEAAVALMLRVARGFDEAQAGKNAAFARIATPVAKYWICRRVSQTVLEALECFGGNGYVEEGPMARLYRDAPLNGIWEGSGNVICLDVLRALEREPDSRDALLAELAAAKGADRRFDAFIASLGADLGKRGDAGGEMAARHLVERMALALEASLLLRHAPSAVADLFIAARLAHAGGLAMGALPAGAAVDPVIERAAFDFRAVRTRGEGEEVRVLPIDSGAHARVRL